MTSKRFDWRGGRQLGKSHAMALVAAAMIKTGKRVALVYIDEDTGETRCDRVVTVPGYDDGRQIEDHKCDRRTCDGNSVAPEPDERA